MKLIRFLPLLFIPFSAIAETHPFTGLYIGGELQAEKHKFSIPYSQLGWNNNDTLRSSSNSNMGVALITGYGVDYGSNFIGMFEGKLKLNNAKTENDGKWVTKSKIGAELSYLQGYRINELMLPYLKVGFSTQSFKVNDDILNSSKVEKQRDGSAIGITYGIGAKFNIVDNFYVGAEYSHSNLIDRNSIKYHIDSIGISMTYHF